MTTKPTQSMTFWWMTAVSAGVAYIAVRVEPYLSTSSVGRLEALPLVTLLAVSILVHPRLRHLLMITLCYGVSFLALRDIVRLSRVWLPPQLNYESYDIGRNIALLTVAGLAAMAGVVETRQPGTVWARRCYFGAASLYFLGMGVVNLFWRFSWQALLLCGTGVTAGLGCVFADRIVATEAEEIEDALPSDEVLQQAREAAHLARLQTKEWRDTRATPLDESAPQN